MSNLFLAKSNPKESFLVLFEKIFCYVLLIGASLTAHAAPVLPSLQAEDLNEKAYLLPKDLPAERTLLLIAYEREQQKDVDTWIEGLNLKTSRLPWLELPILDDYGSWFKWFVDNGMRRGIKSEFDRSKVVTVYTDKAQFNASMGIESEDEIHAVVVTQDGAVIKRATGRFTSDKAAALVVAITQPILQ